MKKKLEAELISIAHRVLKLKNREETKQLQQETKRLYEKLTILRFYEENFEAFKNEIALDALENKIENPAIEEDIVVKQPTIEEEVKVETTIETIEEPLRKEDDSKAPQVALFDGIQMENYKEVDFVKVEEIPVAVEEATNLTFEKAPEPIAEEEEVIIQPESSKEAIFEEIEPEIIKPEVVFEAKKEVVEEEPRTMSLNDRLTKGISFGLNDRIAFEKRLFGGNPDDFNRVVSQLNTFDSFEEARGFINDFVKPDYNNWDGKEEFENRFLEIIERKFN